MDDLALKVACVGVIAYCIVWWYRILVLIRPSRPPLVWRSFIPFVGTARALRVYPDEFLSSMCQAYPKGFSFKSSSEQRLIHFISNPNDKILDLFTSAEISPAAVDLKEESTLEAVDWYLTHELGDSGSLNLVETFGHLSLLIDMKNIFGGSVWKDSTLRQQIVRSTGKTQSGQRNEIVSGISQALADTTKREEVECLVVALEKRMTRFVSIVANSCQHLLTAGILEQVEQQIQLTKKPSDANLLQQCVAESARLHTPIVSTIELKTALTYDVYHFETGDTIAISPYLSARNDVSLERPEEFRLLRRDRRSRWGFHQVLALGRLLQEFDLTLLRKESRVDWGLMAPCSLFVYYQRKSYGIKSKFI